MMYSQSLVKIVFLFSQIYILKLPVKNIHLMLLMSNLYLTLVFIFNNISSSSRGGSNSASRCCYVCQKKTTLECMHGHICWHILNEDINGDIFGFCGRNCSCTSSLKKSSSKGDKTYVKVTSNCEYFHAYKQVPDDITRSHKCTNKPSKNCNSFVWKYNAAYHFQMKHPDLDIPTNFCISENEKKNLLVDFIINYTILRDISLGLCKIFLSEKCSYQVNLMS